MVKKILFSAILLAMGATASADVTVGVNAGSSSGSNSIASGGAGGDAFSQAYGGNSLSNSGANAVTGDALSSSGVVFAPYSNTNVAAQKYHPNVLLNTPIVQAGLPNSFISHGDGTLKNSLLLGTIMASACNADEVPFPDEDDDNAQPSRGETPNGMLYKLESYNDLANGSVPEVGGSGRYKIYHSFFEALRNFEITRTDRHYCLASAVLEGKDGNLDSLTTIDNAARDLAGMFFRQYGRIIVIPDISGLTAIEGAYGTTSGYGVGLGGSGGPAMALASLTALFNGTEALSTFPTTGSVTVYFLVSAPQGQGHGVAALAAARMEKAEQQLAEAEQKRQADLEQRVAVLEASAGGNGKKATATGR